MLSEALNLTMLGMGFVFVFLTFMVFMIRGVYFLVSKISTSEVAIDDNGFTQKNAVVDEDVRTAIAKAIKLYRGGH